MFNVTTRIQRWLGLHRQQPTNFADPHGRVEVASISSDGVSDPSKVSGEHTLLEDGKEPPIPGPIQLVIASHAAKAVESDKQWADLLLASRVVLQYKNQYPRPIQLINFSKAMRYIQAYSTGPIGLYLHNERHKAMMVATCLVLMDMNSSNAYEFSKKVLNIKEGGGREISEDHNQIPADVGLELVKAAFEGGALEALHLIGYRGIYGGGLYSNVMDVLAKYKGPGLQAFSLEGALPWLGLVEDDTQQACARVLSELQSLRLVSWGESWANLQGLLALLLPGVSSLRQLKLGGRRQGTGNWTTDTTGLRKCPVEDLDIFELFGTVTVSPITFLSSYLDYTALRSLEIRLEALSELVQRSNLQLRLLIAHISVGTQDFRDLEGNLKNSLTKAVHFSKIPGQEAMTEIRLMYHGYPFPKREECLRFAKDAMDHIIITDSAFVSKLIQSPHALLESGKLISFRYRYYTSHIKWPEDSVQDYKAMCLQDPKVLYYPYYLKMQRQLGWTNVVYDPHPVAKKSLVVRRRH